MKTRKQLRGFDIAEYIAFNTFPNILNVGVSFNSFTQEICIIDIRTGEIVCRVCDNINDCRELARRANKMIRDNNKFLKEGK